MTKIGILVAMPSEQALLTKAGIQGSVLTGIGKVNAAIATTQLILTQKPDLILSTGVAGAMKPEIRVGDIVVGAQYAYHDVWCGKEYGMGVLQGLPQRINADPSLLESCRALASPSIHFGLITSSSQFYMGPESDNQIRALYPDVLACDMESMAIAHTCRTFGVPFIGIRAISDTHSDETQQTKTYEAFRDGTSSVSFEFVKNLLEKLI